MRRLNWPSSFSYFSTRDVLCNDDGCLTHVGKNLRTDVTTWDYGHMTLAASTYVAEHGLGDFVMRDLTN